MNSISFVPILGSMHNANMQAQRSFSFGKNSECNIQISTTGIFSCDSLAMNSILTDSIDDMLIYKFSLSSGYSAGAGRQESVLFGSLLSNRTIDSILVHLNTNEMDGNNWRYQGYIEINGSGMPTNSLPVWVSEPHFGIITIFLILGLLLKKGIK